MRSRKLDDAKNSLSLTSVQREVLHGCLLGDACLEWSQQIRNPRIKFEQSELHRDYLFHLFDVFKDFVVGEPKLRVRKCNTGMDCGSYWFQTVSHPSFRFFAGQYLCENKKVVPKLIRRWLTPRALAYWFMDDGSIKSKQSKGVLLNTQAFKLSDVERLCEVVGSLGLICSPRRQAEGFQIYVSGKSYERLVELLDPWLVESMRYKLPPARRTQMPKK